MRQRQGGFTLVEIIVSLAIFLMIVIGALGVISASNVGSLGGLNTGLVSGRIGKDTTAATVYLQALQEYAASQGSGQMGSPTTYLCTPNGASWSCSPSLPAGLVGAPQPSSQTFELAWTQITIDVSRWNWDSGASQYSTSAPSSTDSLVRVRSTITWKAGTAQRSITLERFIP